MASKELIEAVKGYENYIKKNGITDELLDAYVLAVKTAYQVENDYEVGKKLARRVKTIINSFIHSKTGGDFFALEKYCKENNAEFKMIDQFYDVLLIEAQCMNLDSALLYLEKKREWKDRYYQHRRKCFKKIGLIQALQDILDDKLDILSISLPPGTGKAQPMYSKVLTPSGFKTMGDMKVGTKVISATGNVCNVVGVYPQGKRKIYEFTFDDGSKCRSADNHLWRVQTREDRRIRTLHPVETYRTITTEEMLKNYLINNGTRANYSIDYVDVIDFENKNFVVHPYVMGVLIGNGHLTTTPEIATTDDEIVENVNKFLPNGYSLKHKERCTYIIKGHEGNNCKAGSIVTKAMKQFGLYGTKSETKFIPKEYLYSSYEQRLWLLKGLMDTDGTVSKCVASYCTVSEQLANDVVELVHSLGGYASVKVKKSGYRDKNRNYIQCKDAYNITIAFASDKCDIFGLSRKSEKYNPKRKKIRRIIKDIQFVGEEECQCIMIDDPSHLYITDNYIITHNTTIEKFLHALICGWYPKDYNLFYSHSGDITRMYYDGVLDILTNKDEYAWNDIFPESRVTSTNAKLEQINIDKYKPFPNVQCTSVGAKNAGKVRASKFLLCDDLIGGIEEALNPNTLEKLWSIYSVDARQRKITGCKEIHIATRWSVGDVIGRLERTYEGNERCRFIAVPDIDPETNESNFYFDVNPFTVLFYNDQEKLMDEVSYKCLYKNEPIEREGLLFPEDKLRTYISLPKEEPDEILGQVDAKGKGTDFMVMPCLYRYGEDYYMVDCVCNSDSDFEKQYESLANLIVNKNIQNVEFESNMGGDRVAEEVSKRVDKKNWVCNITTRATESNKEARIFQCSNWVMQNIIFKDKSLYTPRSEYGEFMTQLKTYSVTGKNKHDDIPDVLSNFCLRMKRREKHKEVSIISSPF